MPIFEARYFCCDDNNIIWPLGCYGGQTDYNYDEFQSRDGDDLIDELFHDLLSRMDMNSVKLRPDNRSFVVDFNQESHDNTTIYLWIGSRAPEIKITSTEKVTPPNTDKKCKGIAVPAYCYELSIDSQFHLNNTILSVHLINYYLQNCTPEEHKSLIDGGKYLRFLLHQDDQYRSPYAYGYLRSIDTCLSSHKQVLESCPSDMLPCEVNLFQTGHFIFINKDKWVNKGELIREDVKFID